MSDDVLEIIRKLGETENSLSKREFISPVYKNKYVVTRIDKIAYTFSIPESKPGWYRFRPVNRKKAKILGPSSFQDTEIYQKLLEKVRIVLVQRDGDVFYGVPFKTNQQGLDIKILYPVYLVLDDMVQDFDEIICRYDGANLWYQAVEANNDQAKVNYLRESLKAAALPKKLAYSGLRFEDKMAYAIRCEIDKKVLERNKEYRLKHAVEHAGGIFKSFTEKGDHFNVSYEVDGEKYTSTIAKNDELKVLTAGICLQSQDQKFDLTSLISVIREGQHRDLIHRTR
jgi:hypothetical protein